MAFCRFLYIIFNLLSQLFALASEIAPPFSDTGHSATQATSSLIQAPTQEATPTARRPNPAFPAQQIVLDEAAKSSRFPLVEFRNRELPADFAEVMNIKRLWSKTS